MQRLHGRLGWLFVLSLLLILGGVPTCRASKFYKKGVLVVRPKTTLGEAAYNLPVLPALHVNSPDRDFHTPPVFDTNVAAENGSGSVIQKKFIPQIVHFAVRNHSHSRPSHHADFSKRNPDWTLKYYDNESKDVFMNKHFANTSVLWVYNLLNPDIGCARPEVWRLAVLYMEGGMYMDDDASIGVPLDQVVQKEDKILLGEEDYDYDDRCWVDEFPLSNYALRERFGDAQKKQLFNGKWLHNWAIFSAPGHPLLRRVLERIVQLVLAEYSLLSLIKMTPTDHKGKLLMCASTYPITAVAREMVLEDKYGSSLGLRTWPHSGYKADMKAWNNDFAPDRWVKAMQKHNKPYLLEYAPPDGKTCAKLLDGRVIQGTGQREIFLVLEGSMHPFPNFDTFVSNGYELTDVKLISFEVLGALRVGEAVDKGQDKYKKAIIMADKRTKLRLTGTMGKEDKISQQQQDRAQRRLEEGKRRRRRLLADDSDINNSNNNNNNNNNNKSGEEVIERDELSDGDARRTIVLTKRLEAAMIFDEERKAGGKSDWDRRYANSVTFLNTLLSPKNGLAVSVNPDTVALGDGASYNQAADTGVLQFKAWPGVFTGDCPGVDNVVLRGDKAKGMDRGLLIAHREIWDHHIKSRYRNAERKKIREEDDVMLIFEDDMYPMVPNHALNALREINRMSSDVHWLGWCYHHDEPLRSPLCMHAYVVSIIGARKLLASTETCGPLPLDRQVRLMCDHNATWGMTMGEWDYRSHHSQYYRGVMEKEGLSVPEVIHYGGYGGIYAQARFDASAQHDPKMVENTLFKVANGGKSV